MRVWPRIQHGEDQIARIEARSIPLCATFRSKRLGAAGGCLLPGPVRHPVALGGRDSAAAEPLPYCAGRSLKDEKYERTSSGAVGALKNWDESGFLRCIAIDYVQPIEKEHRLWMRDGKCVLKRNRIDTKWTGSTARSVLHVWSACMVCGRFETSHRTSMMTLHQSNRTARIIDEPAHMSIVMHILLDSSTDSCCERQSSKLCVRVQSRPTHITQVIIPPEGVPQEAIRLCHSA